MSSELYAILAMAARYWFIALILLIALRAWRMTVKDSRRAKLLRDWSPETGCVGQFVVDPGRGKNHDVLPIPREGVLGSSRRADVRLRGRDIKRFHFSFEARPGGLLVRPRPRAQVVLNKEFTGDKLFAQDGDTLTLGKAKLLLVLFQVQPEEQPFDEEHIWGPDPAQRPAQPQGEAAPVQESARRREKPERVHARSRRREKPDVGEARSRRQAAQQDELQAFEDELWPDD